MPVRLASRGDLDQPPPDLFAAVLVIGQVEGGAGEQVGSSGIARVRNRPQSRGVEDVSYRPLGHYVHDPGLRDRKNIGSGQVLPSAATPRAMVSHICPLYSIIGDSAPTCRTRARTRSIVMSDAAA